jgi:NAD(P)H-dependent FMN reductase
MPPRILVLAGALRQGSYNKKLAAVAAQVLTELGADVDHMQLNEVPMPPYDGDLEEADGLPEGAVAFKKRLEAARGFLFVSPEYNSSIPGTFKNAIDWASRGDGDVFECKVAALMAASPGRFGGVRMMPHLRQVMMTLGVTVVPEAVQISGADKAFNPDGSLANEVSAKVVRRVCERLLQELKIERTP